MASHKLTVRGSGYGGGPAGVSGEEYLCSDTATSVCNTKIHYREATGAGLLGQIIGRKPFIVHAGYISKSDHDALNDVLVTLNGQQQVGTRAHAAYFLYWKSYA